MVFMMDELLRPGEGMVVFEVGTGSGYHAATLAEIVAPSSSSPGTWGHVYSAEIIRSLAIRAQRNLETAGYANRVSVLCRDGSAGLPLRVVADRLLVTAAAPGPPKPLLDQLKTGGRAVIPVGRPVGFFQAQTLVLIEKISPDELKSWEVAEVAFVPLRGKHGWED